MRTFHVQHVAGGAELLVAEVTFFGVEIAQCGAAIRAFRCGFATAGITLRVFQMPDENDFAAIHASPCGVKIAAGKESVTGDCIGEPAKRGRVAVRTRIRLWK